MNKLKEIFAYIFKGWAQVVQSKSAIRNPVHRTPPWLTVLPLVILVFAPFAIGTVHWWSIACVEGLTIIALFSVLLSRRTREIQVPQFILLLTLIVTLFTFFQTIPLPSFVMAIISRKTHEMLSWTLGSLDLYNISHWRPLSLAPIHSLQKLGLFVTYFALMILFINLYSRKSYSRLSLYTIIILGFADFIIAIIHILAEADAIYGLYDIEYGGIGAFTGSFVNPNHQAGFFGIAGFAALGLGFSHSYKRDKRLLFVILSAISFTGLVLTRSRSAIVVFIPALFLFALLHYLRKKELRWVHFAAFALMLCFIFGVALYLSYTPILNEWLTLTDIEAVSNELKFKIMKESLAIIPDFPIFGIGVGAFPVVLPHYISDYFHGTVLYTENELLQVIYDLGILVGGFVILSIIYFALRILKSSLQGSIERGIFVALVFICLQNLGDYSLEIPGVMIPVIALASYLIRHIPDEIRNYRSYAKKTLIIPIAALCVLSGYALITHDDTLVKTRTTIAAVTKTASLKPLEAINLGTEAVEKYPTDYFLHTILGRYALVHLEDPKVHKQTLGWLNRAIYCNPSYYAPHQFAGRYLLSIGKKSQAIDEYAMAINLAKDEGAKYRNEPLKTQIIEEYYLSTHSLSDLDSMVKGDLGSKKIYVNFLISRGLLAEAEKRLTELTQALPQDDELKYSLSRLYLSWNKTEEALKIAVANYKANNKIAWPYMIISKVYQKQGKLKEASEILDKGFSNVDAPPYEMIMARAEIGWALKDPDSIEWLINQFSRDKRLIINLNVMKGQALENIGKIELAYQAFKNALLIDPHYLPARFALAGMWEKRSHLYLALDEYKVILKYDPQNKNAAEAIKRIEAAINQNRRDELLRTPKIPD